MRLRLALTVMSLLGLAVTSATTNGQPLIDRHGKGRQMAMGGDGGPDLLEVDTVHRRLDISRATHLIVMDSDSEEVVGGIAETLTADPDFPETGAAG
jgi:hypothetical protein